jgi:hypothetical protein
MLFMILPIAQHVTCSAPPETGELFNSFFFAQELAYLLLKKLTY